MTATVEAWKLDLLRCAVCGKKLIQAGSELRCAACNFKLAISANIIIDPTISSEEVDKNPYQTFMLSSRVQTPYTTTAREDSQYKEYVRKIVDSLNPDSSLIMDFGCGSGRFTKFLLSLGVKKVIAFDLSLPNLKMLERNLTTDELSKVILLNATALRLSVAPSCLDALFAIGVFHTLPRSQFKLACELTYSLLKPGGLLVNSDPTFEGALIYALVCHDIDEFKAVFKNSTKAVNIRGEKSVRVQVYKPDEVEAILIESGFIPKEKHGISIFPSLIFGGVLPMKQVPEETRYELVNISDTLRFPQISASRVIIYVSEKRSFATEKIL